MAELTLNQLSIDAYPKTWAQYKKIFYQNHVSINESSILNMQKEQIKIYAINNNDALAQLNTELFSQINDFSEIVENQVTENITKNFHNLQERFKQSQQQGISFQDELSTLLASYQTIIGKAINLEMINHSELDSIGKSLYKLQADINLLKSKINNISNYEQLSSLYVKGSNTPKARFVKNKQKNTPSLINQLSGIGSALKGLKLEQIATEVINDRIPSDKDGAKSYNAINIGNIRVEVGGGLSKNIKEDIALFSFETLSKDIEIKLANNKICTLKELIAKANSSETITLTDEGYQQLQSQMLTAISAKAAKNTINLHSGLTVNNILSSAFKDTEYEILKDLHEIKKINASFRENEEISDLLINYNMSKMLTKIIGIRNEFLVTPDGFISMHDYINKHLEHRKYVRVSKAKLVGPMDVII